MHTFVRISSRWLIRREMTMHLGCNVRGNVCAWRVVTQGERGSLVTELCLSVVTECISSRSTVALTDFWQPPRTNQETHGPRSPTAESGLRLDCCGEERECVQHRATCYRIIT